MLLLRVEDDKEDAIPGFTLSELGLMLPKEFTCEFDFGDLETPKSGTYLVGFEGWFFDVDNAREYNCSYRCNNKFSIKVPEESFTPFSTEAEARAAMLIYLLENNHTTPEEVNTRLNNQ